MYQVYDQNQVYQNYVNSVKQMELTEEQMTSCKNDILRTLILTPSDIKKKRDKEVLLQIVWSQQIVDLLMSDQSFPLNYEA